jgi:uncharacterized protein YabN with tetrapyrrole methylase and pyrophosphatase domain
MSETKKGLETQSFSQTEFLVMQWATDRGIYKHGTALGQAKKALSEIQELIEAIEAGDKTEAELEAGDVVVCLVNTCTLLDIDLRQAFYKAFKKIEHRKGYLDSSGIFIKQE